MLFWNVYQEVFSVICLSCEEARNDLMIAQAQWPVVTYTLINHYIFLAGHPYIPLESLIIFQTHPNSFSGTMKLFLSIAIIGAIVNSGESWRSFAIGRKKNGNLGEPNLSKSFDPPKDQWFTQNLDHFNPVEGRTWQQVLDVFFFILFFFLLLKSTHFNDWLWKISRDTSWTPLTTKLADQFFSWSAEKDRLAVNGWSRDKWSSTPSNSVPCVSC